MLQVHNMVVQMNALLVDQTLPLTDCPEHLDVVLRFLAEALELHGCHESGNAASRTPVMALRPGSCSQWNQGFRTEGNVTLLKNMTTQRKLEDTATIVNERGYLYRTRTKVKQKQKSTPTNARLQK